jgi:hypothetical protein
MVLVAFTYECLDNFFLREGTLIDSLKSGASVAKPEVWNLGNVIEY